MGLGLALIPFALSPSGSHKINTTYKQMAIPNLTLSLIVSRITDFHIQLLTNNVPI